MDFGTGTIVPMGWSLSTSLGNQTQQAMPVNRQSRPQKNPGWFNQLSGMGQSQFVAENAPANASASVAPQAQQLYQNMYGKFSGAPLNNGMMGYASQWAQNNPMAQNTYDKAYGQAMKYQDGLLGNGGFNPHGNWQRRGLL